MEDILLMQLLRKKGIISDKDIHELHELTSASLSEEPVYLNSSNEVSYNNNYIGESKAKELVSKMYHIKEGKKYIGEKYNFYTAKEICERYKGIISPTVTPCDIYIAINSQYHDYIELYKRWFTDNIDQKIIESAMIFWFKDADSTHKNKVMSYFMEY